MAGPSEPRRGPSEARGRATPDSARRDRRGEASAGNLEDDSPLSQQAEAFVDSSPMQRVPDIKVMDSAPKPLCEAPTGDMRPFPSINVLEADSDDDSAPAPAAAAPRGDLRPMPKINVLEDDSDDEAPAPAAAPAGDLQRVQSLNVMEEDDAYGAADEVYAGDDADDEGQSALDDALFGRVETARSLEAAAFAAADKARRERAQERARALAYKHRKAAQDQKIFAGSWQQTIAPRRALDRLRLGGLSEPDAAATLAQARFRAWRCRIGLRRRRRGATAIQALLRAIRARTFVALKRKRLDALAQQDEVRGVRRQRLSRFEDELSRLRSTPAKALAQRYNDVHARRRDDRLLRWRLDEEAAAKLSEPMMIGGREDDDVCDFEEEADSPRPRTSRRNSTSTQPSQHPSFDSYESGYNTKRDSVEAQAVREYRGAVQDGSFSTRVASALDLSDGAPIPGAPDLHLVELHERCTSRALRKLHDAEGNGALFREQTGVRRKYAQYFAAKTSAEELQAARSVTQAARDAMRDARRDHLALADSLADALNGPLPTLAALRAKHGLEPKQTAPLRPAASCAALGVGEVDYFDLPPEGPDRARARRMHAATMSAATNASEWWSVHLPEDVGGPRVDIRGVAPPNVAWPFQPARSAKKGAPPLIDPDESRIFDEHEASLYWYAFARKGLRRALQDRRAALLKKADDLSLRASLAAEADGSEKAISGAKVHATEARAKVHADALLEEQWLDADADALLERAKMGPEGRRRSAVEAVLKRSEYIGKWAYSTYLECVKVAELDHAPGRLQSARRQDSESKDRNATKIQALWRGGKSRVALRAEQRNRKVLGALQTLVAELHDGPSHQDQQALLGGLSAAFGRKSVDGRPSSRGKTAAQPTPAKKPNVAVLSSKFSRQLRESDGVPLLRRQSASSAAESMLTDRQSDRQSLSSRPDGGQQKLRFETPKQPSPPLSTAAETSAGAAATSAGTASSKKGPRRVVVRFFLRVLQPSTHFLQRPPSHARRAPSTLRSSTTTSRRRACASSSRQQLVDQTTRTTTRRPALHRYLKRLRTQRRPRPRRGRRRRARRRRLARSRAARSGRPTRAGRRSRPRGTGTRAVPTR
ncbi:hypothetical protein M885DRAFT_295535 [Pelagophyceae sp. CCMP2097]|nr:hypothetical protein M885DRAFT_295535 [Pelagophyceae sp. CCMP2097]